MISQLRRFVSRITGFSTPIIGLSWTPEEPERETIRALLTFLEDRRTLYNPYIMEICEHSYVSVHEIRDELTKVISQINEDSRAISSLRAMRAACRKFLDDPSIAVSRFTHYPISSESTYVDQEKVEYYQRFYEPRPEKEYEKETRFLAGFFIKLGELRAVFGSHIKRLSELYDLTTEQELSSIFPAEEEKVS